MKIFKILYLILAVAVISSFSTAAVAEAASIKVVSVKVIKKKNDWRAKLTKEQIREKENYAKTVKIYVKKEIDNVEYLITYGAGFRLANGYIVTNEHVVSNGGYL